MKLQNFSQFINESALTASKISAGLTALIPEEEKAKAQKYFGVDYNTLMKDAAPKVVGIMDTLANTINDPNFNPKTMPAEVTKFENELYPLVTQTVDSIMDNLENAKLLKSPILVGVRTVFKAAKPLLRNQFLTNNAADQWNGPIALIVRSVINLMLTNLMPDITSARATQTQLTNGGKPVPPFTLNLSDGTPKTYGHFQAHPSLTYSWYTHATKKGQSLFKDGSKKDGCYNLDYWFALSDLLADRAPKITQQIKQIINARVFS